MAYHQTFPCRSHWTLSCIHQSCIPHSVLVFSFIASFSPSVRPYHAASISFYTSIHPFAFLSIWSLPETRLAPQRGSSQPYSIQSLRGPQQGWTAVAHSINLLLNINLDWLSSVPCLTSPVSHCTPWNHLPNKPPAPKPLSQGLSEGRKVRHHHRNIPIPSRSPNIDVYEFIRDNLCCLPL